MRRWSLPLAVALAALGLQGCDRQAPITTVVPPTASLPDDTVLRPGAAPTAAAPAASATTAQAAAPAAPEIAAAAPAPAAPVVAAAPVAPAVSPAVAPAEPALAAASAPGPDTAAMGAAPAASASTPAATPQGTAAPTEMSTVTQPGASTPAASGKGQKVSTALPQVRDPGDARGAQLLAQRSLLLPVVGLAPGALADTYDQGRGKRKHEATDILAPAGTPVVAVDDGRIAKLFTSKAGGLTIYEYDVPRQLAYYYAHLQGYAPTLREGMDVKRGDLIGYVGTTGNADVNTPHLHFAVFRLGNPPQWWKGEPVNPYPALSRATPADQVAAR